MPAAAPSAHPATLGVVTLLSWLCTAGLGAYMLRTVAARGGLRQQRATRGALPPGVLTGHFSLALSGLVSWAGYLATGWAGLAWLAVGLLMPAIGLGICTVTLWTPYPRAPSPASPGAAAGPPGTGRPDHPDPSSRDASGGTAPGEAAPGPARGRGGGLLPPPPPDAVRGRLTDAMLARALTDEALAARLIDQVIASLPAQPPARRKQRAYPAAIIPFSHGLGAIATFVLAVVTAAGAQ